MTLFFVFMFMLLADSFAAAKVNLLATGQNFRAGLAEAFTDVFYGLSGGATGASFYTHGFSTQTILAAACVALGAIIGTTLGGKATRNLVEK